MVTDWRTPTVIALCEAMRETRDYTAAPILADALEDAGCPYAETMASLRSSLIPFWQAERLVGIVYSEEIAKAVEYLDKLAVDLGEGGYPGYLPGFTYETLMNHLRRSAEGEIPPDWSGSMNWSNFTMDIEDEIWANFKTVTGLDRPRSDDYWDDTWRCAC